MKLPAFDKNGDINMGEVMMSHSKYFEEFGVEVGVRLKDLKDRLSNMSYANYSKEKSDYIHLILNVNETEAGRKRQPLYQHSAIFCFYYNLYAILINSCIYPHHASEAEMKKIDQEILEREIQI